MLLCPEARKGSASYIDYSIIILNFATANPISVSSVKSLMCMYIDYTILAVLAYRVNILVVLAGIYNNDYRIMALDKRLNIVIQNRTLTYYVESVTEYNYGHTCTTNMHV